MELDQVLEMDDAEHVIDRLFVDRYPRVATLEHLLDQFGDRRVRRISVDLGPRNHDLRYIHLRCIRGRTDDRKRRSSGAHIIERFARESQYFF